MPIYPKRPNKARPCDKFKLSRDGCAVTRMSVVVAPQLDCRVGSVVGHISRHLRVSRQRKTITQQPVAHSSMLSRAFTSGRCCLVSCVVDGVLYGFGLWI